jgi:lipopolysaccharide transport system permease protein
MFRQVWQHRELLFSLVRRQYQLRYRQSAVGLAWALLPPLAALGVGAVVFDLVVGVDTGSTPYGVFAMAALVPWTFLAGSVTQGTPSIVGSLLMVTRMAFPRAVLPLSVIGLSLLDLGVAMAVFLGLAVTVGDGIPLTALWVPVLLAIELVLVVGLVLFGSALNVFARDIRIAVPLLIQFWLFLTPVMYPLDAVPPTLRGLYLANPMTGLVESFRQVLIAGHAPDPVILLPTIVGAIGFFLLGWWYFSSTEPRFADAV